MPLARDRRLSKRRPEVVLKATQGVYNNIPYKNLIAYFKILVLVFAVILKSLLLLSIL